MPTSLLKAAPYLLVVVLCVLYIGARARREAAETTASTLTATVNAQSADIASLMQANAEFEALAKQAAAITASALADAERAQAHAAKLAAQAKDRQQAADAALRAFQRRTANPDCKAVLDLPVCPALQEQ